MTQYSPRIIEDKIKLNDNMNFNFILIMLTTAQRTDFNFAIQDASRDSNLWALTKFANSRKCRFSLNNRQPSLVFASSP